MKFITLKEVANVPRGTTISVGGDADLKTLSKEDQDTIARLKASGAIGDEANVKADEKFRQELSDETWLSRHTFTGDHATLNPPLATA